jgi:hypothetical protein
MRKREDVVTFFGSSSPPTSAAPSMLTAAAFGSSGSRSRFRLMLTAAASAILHRCVAHVCQLFRLSSAHEAAARGSIIKGVNCTVNGRIANSFLPTGTVPSDSRGDFPSGRRRGFCLTVQVCIVYVKPWKYNALDRSFIAAWDTGHSATPVLLNARRA